MNRKLVLTTIFITALIGMLGLSFKAHRVEASGTIYIKADGSIEGTTSIHTADNVTYVFVASINDSIVVERNNIIMDGNGYALQGTGQNDSKGVDLSGRTNVTVQNATIKAFGYGIYLNSSSYNMIFGNNITANNRYGIGFYYLSNNNMISGNNITNNNWGIGLAYSLSNMISGNNITNNYNGIWLVSSSNNNMIYHNSFVDNYAQVYNNMSYPSMSVWDDGYPSGGNYWSNYTGVDSDYDGIGDSWYQIDSSNIDHYPLMGRSSDFKITSEHHVQTICNSSISDFKFNGTAICFNVSGESGTAGFCRICIPTALMNSTYKVFVNRTEVSCTLLLCSNETHSYLYFNYTHSTQEVIITPEFSSILILPLFMIATLLAVIVYKRKYH